MVYIENRIIWSGLWQCYQFNISPTSLLLLPFLPSHHPLILSDTRNVSQGFNLTRELSLEMSLTTKPHRGLDDDDSDWVSCSDESPGSSISPGSDQHKGLISTLKSKRKSWLTSFSLGRNGGRGEGKGTTNHAGAHVSTPRSLDHGLSRLAPEPATAPAPPKSPPEPSNSAPLVLVPGLTRLFQNLTRRSQLLSTTSIIHTVTPRSGRSQHTPDSPSSTPGPPHNNVDGVDDDEEAANTARIYPLPATKLNPSPPTCRTRTRIATMDLNNPTRSPNLADLLTGLSSPEDATRKMAAFKLQSLINDPSFAEHFVISGGLPRLRSLILETNGNTLAYSLASFARLLEVDQGWEAVNNKVVEKARHPEYLHFKMVKVLTDFCVDRL
jgi:hypothetical protein